MPDPGPLTYRQRLFVAAYLGAAGGNATEAARMAGYRCPKQQGHRLLTNVDIMAAVDARLESAGLGADEVLARLSDIASADIGDLAGFFVEADGVARFDLKAAHAAGLSHIIKSVRVGPAGVAVELHDSLAALIVLAKHWGLLGPRRGASGPPPPPEDVGWIGRLMGRLRSIADRQAAMGVPDGDDG
jgi:hypothetical protein